MRGRELKPFTLLKPLVQRFPCFSDEAFEKKYYDETNIVKCSGVMCCGLRGTVATGVSKTD